MVKKQYETYNKHGQMIAICKRPESVGVAKISYIAHLLLGIGKGWSHVDNLTQRLWGVRKVEYLKPYQLTPIINELRLQNEEAGVPL